MGYAPVLIPMFFGLMWIAYAIRMNALKGEEATKKSTSQSAADEARIRNLRKGLWITAGAIPLIGLFIAVFAYR